MYPYFIYSLLLRYLLQAKLQSKDLFIESKLLSFLRKKKYLEIVHIYTVDKEIFSNLKLFSVLEEHVQRYVSGGRCYMYAPGRS